MLSVFKRLVPIPNQAKTQNHYTVSTEDLRREIVERGLSVVLESNPNNPTGQLIEGEELKKRVEMARDTRCTLIMDEFYSGYLYTHDPNEGITISAAEYIEDVNQDPIVIVDGLTKNWRLPGWRVCWIVGPKSLIDSVGSAGSFLEGGANSP
jgi:aspartate/methionine/tyrosine aminotransferase